MVCDDRGGVFFGTAHLEPGGRSDPGDYRRYFVTI